MLNKCLTVSILLVCTLSAKATTWYVEKFNSIPNSYSTIQGAINAAADGDTVKILPGIYDGEVTLTKNLIIIGSGYETTIVRSLSGNAITMSSGIVQWLTATSNTNVGMLLRGGVVRNCVARGSLFNGIASDTGVGQVINCTILENGGVGVYSNGTGTIIARNCISVNNDEAGYARSYDGGPGGVYLMFSAGTASNVDRGSGYLDISDPAFISPTDIHLQNISPCIDTGDLNITDPDGSRSDMGYFGGEHVPTFPIVKNIRIIPLEGGGVRIEATGVANY